MKVSLEPSPGYTISAAWTFLHMRGAPIIWPYSCPSTLQQVFILFISPPSWMWYSRWGLMGVKPAGCPSFYAVHDTSVFPGCKRILSHTTNGMWLQGFWIVFKAFCRIVRYLKIVILVRNAEIFRSMSIHLSFASTQEMQWM